MNFSRVKLQAVLFSVLLSLMIGAFTGCSRMDMGVASAIQNSSLTTTCKSSAVGHTLIALARAKKSGQISDEEFRQSKVRLFSLF